VGGEPTSDESAVGGMAAADTDAAPGTERRVLERARESSGRQRSGAAAAAAAAHTGRGGTDLGERFEGVGTRHGDTGTAARMAASARGEGGRRGAEETACVRGRGVR
jgi:hypothetical protein